MHHSALIAKARRLSVGEKEEADGSSEMNENGPSESVLKMKIKMNKIRFLKQTNIYQPFISKPMNFPHGLFESTVNFFSDLVELSNILVSSSNRKNDLMEYL